MTPQQQDAVERLRVESHWPLPRVSVITDDLRAVLSELAEAKVLVEQRTCEALAAADNAGERYASRRPKVRLEVKATFMAGAKWMEEYLTTRAAAEAAKEGAWASEELIQRIRRRVNCAASQC